MRQILPDRKCLSNVGLILNISLLHLKFQQRNVVLFMLLLKAFIIFEYAVVYTDCRNHQVVCTAAVNTAFKMLHSYWQR